MKNKKFIKSVFFISFLLLNFSFATENELKISVAELMNVETKQIELKKQTEGMTSSQSYSFTLNDKKYIVKIFAEKHNLEYRKKEVNVTKIFSDLGLGAKLIAVGDKHSFYIREYLPGRTLKYSDLQDNKTLITLAKALRKLHKHKEAGEIKPSRTLLDRAEKHFQSLVKKDIATPSGFEESYTKFKGLIKSLKVTEGFCHNDLNPQNIILTPEGKIYFIDFANSGYSNTYEDLGYLTLLNGISEKKLEQFLTAYYERKPTQEEMAQIKLAQKVVCFVSATVYFDFSESEKDKGIDKKTRTENLDKMMKSPEVKSMIEYIKENKVVSVKSQRKDDVKRYAISCYKHWLQTR